jgi:hypothetical protein
VNAKEIMMRKKLNDHYSSVSGSVKQWLDGAAVPTLAVLAMLGVACTSTVLLFSITAIVLAIRHQF